MGVESFTVHLTRPSSKYFYPGQTVQGEVVIANRKNTIFYDLYLKVKGSANVGLEGFGAEFKGTDIYFNQKLLLTSNIGGDRTEQKPGVYQFPFSFTLPTGIPPSFEGKYGNVRYTVKAVMKRSWPKKNVAWNYVHVRVFVDFDTNLIRMIPPRQTCQRNVGSGSIKLQAWLDRISYIPGDIVFVHGLVDNASEKTVNGIKIQLLQYVTFYADRMYNATRQNGTQKFATKKVSCLQAESKESILEESQKRYLFTMIVPDIPPSGLPYCQLIHVEYILKLAVDYGSFWSSDVVVRMKIHIGSNQLRTRSASNPDLPNAILTPNNVSVSCSTQDSTTSLNSFSAASSTSSVALLGTEMEPQPNFHIWNCKFFSNSRTWRS